MRSLKVLTAKVEAQSKILEKLEAQLNNRQAASGLAVHDGASILKYLPLQSMLPYLNWRSFLKMRIRQPW